MSMMDVFRETHGEGATYQRPSKAVLRKYAGKIHEDLLGEWEKNGWCSYSGGKIWTVNPDDYAGVLAEWLPKWKPSNTFVLARGAFGDLIVSHKDSAGQLNVHYGRYVDMGGPFFVFFFPLTKKYVDKALRGELADKAKKKLGPLAHDEMFTFEPALALGGSDTLKSIAKVKLSPQLGLLAQLFDSVAIE